MQKLLVCVAFFAVPSLSPRFDLMTPHVKDRVYVSMIFEFRSQSQDIQKKPQTATFNLICYIKNLHSSPLSSAGPHGVIQTTDMQCDAIAMHRDLDWKRSTTKEACLSDISYWSIGPCFNTKEKGFLIEHANSENPPSLRAGIPWLYTGNS